MAVESDGEGPGGPVLRARVLDVELARPLAAVAADPDGAPAYPAAWLVVRLLGEPLGVVVVDLPRHGLSAAALGRVLTERFAGDVVRRVPATGDRDTATGDWDTATAAVRAGAATDFARAHAEHRSHAPPLSVVVCTRNNPAELGRCLESLVEQDHPDLQVVVVDNGPAAPGTRDVADRFAGRLDLAYVAEPQPGLSRARNTALRQRLRGEVVAWVDDDELADPLWATELSRSFAGRPDVWSASGVVVPAELETIAQVWFEEFGGHSKGRGFVPAEFGRAVRSTQSPLFPQPPFGVGANMAFRVDALRGLGGFDEALGAGTRTGGAEDTKVFTQVLRAGGTSRYVPTALTRHVHRRSVDELRRQMTGYGSGLTAYYTALVLDDPTVLVPLARLTGRALHEVLSPGSDRHATLGDHFPKELLTANRRGLLAGPARYVRQRLADRTGRHHGPTGKAGSAPFAR